MAATPTIPPRTRTVQRAEHRLYTFLLRYPRAQHSVLRVSWGQCPPEQSVPVLMGCWAPLTRWLRRTHAGISYIGLVEQNEGRHAHIHVVTSRSIARPALEAAWQRCGGSYANVQRISDPAGKAAYLAARAGRTGRLMASEGA